MSEVFITRRGGAGLNFKVVGGTVQPTSPRENTIWVNTAVAIPSYVFSAAAPSAPVEGMVWLFTGLSASATISIGNGAVLLPVVSAFQSVSGSWVRKNAQIYQSGAWADILNVLLPPASTWTTTKIYNSENYTLGSVNLTDTSVALAAGNMKGAGICLDTPIDFTNSDTLRVYFSLGQAVNSDRYNFVVYVDTTRQAIRPAVTKIATSADAARGYVELDVSSVNGSYLILAGLTNWSDTTVIGQITKVVLS